LRCQSAFAFDIFLTASTVVGASRRQPAKRSIRSKPGLLPVSGDRKQQLWQWNDSEAAISVEVDPAFWQTWWFRVLCVAAALGLLWALYQLRLRQVARQFNIRLEERVSERTRIARDLHDTLLQSFHGLLLRFQTVLTYSLRASPNKT